jgi:hypothetical protein
MNTSLRESEGAKRNDRSREAHAKQLKVLDKLELMMAKLSSKITHVHRSPYTLHRLSKRTKIHIPFINFSFIFCIF